MSGITELKLFLEQVPTRNPAAVWDQLCDAIRSPALPVAMVIDDDQTVQFAWDTHRYHIDIEIPTSGDPEWFFLDRETGTSDDGSFREDFNQLVGYLRRVV